MFPRHSLCEHPHLSTSVFSTIFYFLACSLFYQNISFSSSLSSSDTVTVSIHIFIVIQVHQLTRGLFGSPAFILQLSFSKSKSGGVAFSLVTTV